MFAAFIVLDLVVTGGAMRLPNQPAKESLQLNSMNRVELQERIVSEVSVDPAPEIENRSMEENVFYVGLIFIGISAAALFVDVSPTLRAHGVCFLYVILSTCTDLCIKLSSKHWGAFDPAVLTFLGEILKLVITMMLVLAGLFASKGADLQRPTRNDVLLFIPPAILYTMSNILLFQFISHVDIGTFGIARETAVIWAAIWWVAIFRANLGEYRVLAISTMFLLQVVSCFVRGSRIDFSSSWVLINPMLSTIAAVANEAALKGTKLDINYSNAMLYSMCAVLAGLYVVTMNPVYISHPASLLDEMSIDGAYIIALQCTMGLIVSRILKYACAITKQICVGLRGPVIIAAYAIVLHQVPNSVDLIFAILVAACAVYYTLQGPPQMDKQPWFAQSEEKA